MSCVSWLGLGDSLGSEPAQLARATTRQPSQSPCHYSGWSRSGVCFCFFRFVSGLPRCGLAFPGVPGGFRVVLGCSGVFSGAGSGAGI